MVPHSILIMAHTPPPSDPENSAPKSESFEATGRAILERALALHAQNQPLDCADIQESVAKVCDQGKAKRLPPERLIVELKQIWYSVPDSAARQKADVISRLVTMCILEFYRGKTSVE